MFELDLDERIKFLQMRMREEFKKETPQREENLKARR